MREPATALTDYLLALVAAACLRSLLRRGRTRHRLGAPLFFGGFAAAAVCGGTWHGFAPEGFGVLWWLTLVCTGVAAGGLALVGLEGLGCRAQRGLGLGAAVALATFGGYTWWDRRFLVAVVANGAATVLCLAGLAAHARRGARRGAALAAGGLLVSVLGAVLQQAGVAIHAVHFDHNATYHLWLLAALGLFHAGIRRIAAEAAT